VDLGSDLVVHDGLGIVADNVDTEFLRGEREEEMSAERAMREESLYSRPSTLYEAQKRPTLLLRPRVVDRR
jgi:hypothetical protein